MSSQTLSRPVTDQPDSAVGQVTLPVQWRDPVVSLIMTLLTLLLTLFSKGYSNISFKGASRLFEGGTWTIPAAPTGWIMFAVGAVLTGLIWYLALGRKHVPGWMLVVVGVAFVVTFLVWMVADRPLATLPLVSLLSGGLMFATPLVFGALAGVVNERSGIINIAIEGQLLLGAFAGVVAASIFGSSWLGLIGAALAGMALGALLGWFTITFRTENIVVGVVLNMLALGITSFLFSTLLKNSTHLNQPMKLPIIRIPLLADIPVVGPVLFNQTILVYLMYAAVIIMQFMLFNSRWGLRVRAAGEKPKAADTVGIRVNRIRWQSVLLGGALAGLGGAFFTLGQDLAFSKNMAAGNGFIALAAMILGRWNPTGALTAALLFGFATNLGAVMQSVGAPIPAEYVLMTPYVVTVLAVAGFVGAVRPPAAEGKPYP